MRKKIKESVVVSNVLYMLHNWWKWDKKSFLYLAIRVPSMVILPMITALIPKAMIDCIQNQVSFPRLLFVVTSLSLIVAGSSWLTPFMGEKLTGSARTTRMRYAILAFDKTMDTDFVNVESLAGRERLERSKQFYFSNWSGSADFYDCVCQFAVAVIGMIASMGLLYKVNFTMILVILLSCLGECVFVIISNKLDVKFRARRNKLFVKFSYFYKISHDFSTGKDIRIYGISDWLIKMAADAISSYNKIISKITRQTFQIDAGRAVLNLIRQSVAYVYLIYCVLSDIITVSEFIFYFGIITGFSTWTATLIYQLDNISRCAKECGKYREYIELPDLNDDENAVSIPKSEAYSIEFKDVDFSYNNSENMTIKKMNFKINKGDNIAIVGENGAGKTTAIKLLCGLYKPTKGTILVNEVDTANVSSKEYFSLFSAVFQDYNFLPMSVEKNIALCKEEDIDTDKVMSVVHEAGISEKLKSLPDGIKTMMVKEVFKGAVDFSGGEKQKLLLARALYKGAPILILDEPTAALDPIAENELYLKYNDLTQGKTSFFISHRLSSTRFCDRILYIDDGTVCEEGTHEELMALKGKYYRMFQLQSYYYREKEEA